MTIKISIEDLENYLRKHAILFSLLVLTTTSLSLRYILFDFGLYFWASYIVLELTLVIGSLCFGGLLNNNRAFRPLLIVLMAALLPLIAVGFDQLYLFFVLPYVGAITTSIPNIHASAEWLTSAQGILCLSTKLSITSDAPWVITTAEMLILFILSRIFGKHPGNGDLVPA